MDGMPKGILYVESRPTSPEQEAEYHKWYNDTHLAEVVAVPGFVAARRYTPVREDGGPFVAIYDVEADDLRGVMRELNQALTDKRIYMSDAIQMDPPPTMRLLELSASYGPDPD
jgi:hypothetical protein